MTAPTSNRFDSILSAGASTGASGLVPVVTIRSPSSSDITGPNGPYRLGQSWINSVANSSYTLTSLTSSAGLVTANWEAAGATSTLATLTASSGGALTPTAGNINILGTANQVTTAGSGSTITLSIPAIFIAPGSIAATTTVTATLGNISATAGNFVSSTSGNGLIFNSPTATGAASGPVVLNGRSGDAIFTGVSIAAGASLTLTITNSAITGATTQIIYSMQGCTAGAALTIQSVTNSAGSSAVVVTNGTGATTTTANIALTFLVLN